MGIEKIEWHGYIVYIYIYAAHSKIACICEQHAPKHQSHINVICNQHPLSRCHSIVWRHQYTHYHIYKNPLIDMDTSIAKACTQYTRKSIVYSQFIGYKRICSDKFTFEYQASNIFQHFLIKDYPFKLIYDEFRKAATETAITCCKIVIKLTQMTLPIFMIFIQQFNNLTKT